MITLQRVTHVMEQAGLSWFVPLIRFLAGDDPREQLKAMWLV
ncbi:MAG: hypothetical protein ACREYE_22800 [Gammaproteobacteria bacterium]